MGTLDADPSTMTKSLSHAQSLVDSDADVRRTIRRAAGLRDDTPIEVVPGGARPHLEGELGYHTTPSGKTIVRHPSAYKWRTTYHCSTHRVEVGWSWVRRHCPVPWTDHLIQRQIDRVLPAVQDLALTSGLPGVANAAQSLESGDLTRAFDALDEAFLDVGTEDEDTSAQILYLRDRVDGIC